MGTSTNCTQQIKRDPHTAHATMAHLRTLFGNRIWSLQAELEWSPQSPDLATLDFFLWDAAKAEMYKEKPCSLRQLKQAVEAFIQSVTTDTCRRVIENFAVRINACANRNGVHIENVNYKKFGLVSGMLMHMPKYCNKMFPTELLYIFDFISFTFCLLKFLKSERIVKHPVMFCNLFKCFKF